MAELAAGRQCAGGGEPGPWRHRELPRSQPPGFGMVAGAGCCGTVRRRPRFVAGTGVVEYFPGSRLVGAGDRGRSTGSHTAVASGRGRSGVARRNPVPCSCSGPGAGATRVRSHARARGAHDVGWHRGRICRRSRCRKQRSSSHGCTAGGSAIRRQRPCDQHRFVGSLHRVAASRAGRRNAVARVDAKSFLGSGRRTTDALSAP